jgi:acyl-CoA synthetase (AMP-forming)/AMP-acid ligase II
MSDAGALHHRIIDYFERQESGRFESLALEVFAYQYARNRPYRAFCDRRGRASEHVSDWRQIPAVPTAAFKVADLTCRPRQPSAYFLTSGTTQGNDRRGRHLVADLSLIRAAILPNAHTHLFPDLAPGCDRLLILSLTPPPPLRPHSSLIHMIDLMIAQWGAAESGYYAGERGLDAEALAAALRRAEHDRRPVALLGTTAAFIRYFEYCAEQRVPCALPTGSRIMDTGGNKQPHGAPQPLYDRQPFFDACARYLGIPAQAVVNEYGMTELSSQFYSATLSQSLRGVGASEDGVTIPHGPPHTMTVPPWTRVRVIDPETGDDAPAGRPGLLRVYDLANLHSVMAIQTDDLGIRSGIRSPMQSDDEPDRFQIIGRAAGAEPRGCSLDPAASSLLRR